MSPRLLPQPPAARTNARRHFRLTLTRALTAALLLVAFQPPALAQGGGNGNSTTSQIANLQAQINTVQANLDAAKAQLQTAINHEAAARTAADANLRGQIDSVTAALGDAQTALNGAIAQEAAARAAADNELGEAINTEKGARETADAQISQAVQATNEALDAETSARQAADSGLRSQLDAEANTRQAEDTAIRNSLNTAVGSLTTQIEAETTRATDSEAGLSNNISSIQTTQGSLTTNLQNAQNAINTLNSSVGGQGSDIQTLSTALQNLIAEVAALRSDSAPVGTIMAFAGPAAKIPAGWELCDGRLLTRNADTQAIFNAIGVSWGSTDAGVTNFRLPDLRGRFLRGLDASPTQGESGRDPYRFNRSQNAFGGNSGNAVGSVHGDTTRFPRHNSFFTSTNGHHNHNNGAFDRLLIFDGHGTIAQHTDSGSEGRQPNLEWNAPMVATGNHSHSIHGGDNETAPQNAAVLYIIRVK